MTRRNVLLIAGCVMFLSAAILGVGGGTADGEESALAFPVQGKNGMVVTGQELATRAALDVMKGGGNAVDAAVTAAFVMAVTLPRAGNIGGGGFMLIYQARTKEIVAIDFWQKAPLRSTVDMFLDGKGGADSRLSRQSHLATAVPGTVAGLAMILEKYGTIPLAKALEPAVSHARHGFVLNEKLVADMTGYEDLLRSFPATRRIFFKPDGRMYEPGDLFIQTDLAGTLELIGKEGPKVFYEGIIGQKMVRQIDADGVIMTMKDLAEYRPVVRSPVRGTYRGYGIYSMPPPSSGGVGIIEILNILERFNLAATGHNSAATIHRVAEAMKRTFADLFTYLGDADFVTVPVARLISRSHGEETGKSINLQKATAAADIGRGDTRWTESDETTHFSVVDRFGNGVSSTYTLNGNFGNGRIVEGAGFLLNNEMDNFNLRPGKVNGAGYTESYANAIAPGKRMLTAMSPTIVTKDGNLFLVTGSPGSSRIISTNVQVIMNVVDHGMNIQEAVNAPKVHHEWLPDELRLEKGVSPDTTEILSKMGHAVRVRGPMGASSTVMVDPKSGMRYGATDSRREGLAMGY